MARRNRRRTSRRSAAEQLFPAPLPLWMALQQEVPFVFPSHAGTWL